MAIACSGCTQRERIIGELEDENRRLAEKVVYLKAEITTYIGDEIKLAKDQTKHMSLSEAMRDGY